MNRQEQYTQPFTIAEVRELVKDLFAPKAWIYWTDLLVSLTLGWGSFYFAAISPFLSWKQIGLILIATFALYRAMIFIHELTHLKKGTFGFFRLTWNVLCGFPLMNPSMTYEGVHMDHHVRDNYGTTTDGEYLPFGEKHPIHMIGHVAICVFLPFVFMGRYLILAPISIVSKKFRDWIWYHASSLSIDLDYVRTPPSASERTARIWMETFCFLYAMTFVLLLSFRILPMNYFFVWYSIGVLIFFFNGLRTLAAHRYANGSGNSLTVIEQFLDSVNVSGNPITTPLWAPVALRYHGVHHLFAAMPYHHLGAAHRRLVKALPKNSIYYQTLFPSLPSVLADLWKRSVASQKKS
jgi:fatty acid desaturase